MSHLSTHGFEERAEKVRMTSDEAKDISVKAKVTSEKTKRTTYVVGGLAAAAVGGAIAALSGGGGGSDPPAPVVITQGVSEPAS